MSMGFTRARALCGNRAGRSDLEAGGGEKQPSVGLYYFTVSDSIGEASRRIDASSRKT